MLKKRVVSSLYPHDATVVCFGVLLSVLNVAFLNVISQWYLLVLVNLLVSWGVIAIARFDERNPVATFVHHWYPVPLIFLTFKELYLMIAPMHGRDYDDVLIAIDRWMFGVDPTAWLARFANPTLTEVLQIAYASYYFLLVIVAAELYRRSDKRDFLFYAFLIVYGFFLSYIGYLFLPAVGPRFTLHDFGALDTELPGLFFTNVLRDFVNAGESIPPGVPNPIACAQRDVFPSGHTMMMLIMMHVVVRQRMKVKWWILINGVLMIIATVYLRYHYVIDLIAGAALYGVCVWTAPRVYGWWEKMRRAQ